MGAAKTWERAPWEQCGSAGWVYIKTCGQGWTSLVKRMSFPLPQKCCRSCCSSDQWILQILQAACTSSHMHILSLLPQSLSMLVFTNPSSPAPYNSLNPFSVLSLPGKPYPGLILSLWTYICWLWVHLWAQMFYSFKTVSVTSLDFQD